MRYVNNENFSTYHISKVYAVLPLTANNYASHVFYVNDEKMLLIRELLTNTLRLD